MNQATCAPHGQRTGGILSGLLAKILLTVTLCGAAVQALAQVCPGPGNLVAGPASGIVNNYYQANGNLSVGATSLVLGALDGRGMSTPMAVGDLLMIIQMQDASINTSNNNTYGDGSGTGQGATSVGRTGLYEWVRVTSTGASIGITPPLTNSYVQADAGGAPQKRYQVIRAMQYTSATANGVTAPAWNGLTGGVVAMDVRDTLTLGGGTVEGQANRAFFLAGKGFRGGAGRRLAVGGSSRNDYATPATTDYHAAKGEGIAGTPYYASRLTSNWGFQATNPPALAIDTLAPGYPGGSSARGAPGNAGGGGTDGRAVGSGNDENSGGGGGGNYGPGGTGGRPWNDPLYDTGGRGGAGYSGTLAFNRVFLGGGGGAGSSNDGTSDSVAYFNQAMGCNLGTLGLCSSGAAGGGIVLIRARSVTGSGVIDVRGAHAYNVGNDSGGGGGAAGSAVVQSLTGGNATIDARGGDGGNAWAGNAGGLPNRHGPGGAGGGGFIAYSPASMSLATQVDGGAPGKTMSDLVPDENYGSTGYNGGLTAFLAPNAPGVPQAALCDPSVSLAKTNGTTSLTSPGTVTYSLTVSNSGLGPTLGTVTVADKLPAGLSVAPGALTVSGPNAASWTCTAANSTDITCNTTGSIPGGGSSTFAIDVALSAANGSSIVNRARVTGGGDSGKPPSATPVADAEACTANNTPAGCALDSDTVVAPNLVLTKTDNTSTVVSGGTTTYVLVVSNTGGTATSGTIRVVDVLPTGLTFAGTTTTGAFTCTLAAPTLTCDQATALAAGASATITFRVTADAAAPSAVTNLARAGGGGDPSPGKPLPTAATAATCPAPVPPAETNSDPNTGCAADTSLVQYVSLALTKSDGASFVSQNGTTDYLFTISNIGTAPTSGTISFRDAFTSTMTVSGALATPFNPAGPNGANWTCVRNSTTDVSCTTVVSIAAGANSAFILTANVGAAGAGTQQRNKARIGGGGDVRAGMVTSPTSANVAACTTDGSPLGCAIDLNTVQAGAEVRMTKTHPNPQARSPGDTFSHTLLVTNSGGGAAGAGTVQVIDVVPAGLVIGAITVSGFAPCAVAGQVVTCTSDTNLPVGGSLSVTIPVTVSAGASTELINRAQVGTNGPDPQNNTFPTAASAGLCSGTDVPTLGCATDTVPLNADLQITKLQRRGTTDTFTTSVPVVPTGSTVQFRIDVTNSGPGNVNTATIADTVPVNFTNVTWVCGNLAGTATCSAASGAGNAISLTGNISSGGSLRLTVTAVATFPTAVSGVVNTASVTAPTGIVDTNSANNSGTVTTTVGVTNLSITKTNGTTTVTSGGTTSYTIVVTNTGDYPADGARLYDPVVAGLSCTAPPICLAAGPATSCPIGLTAAQLQNATAPAGVAIPAFGAGGSITLTYACNVTATGQ
jgi:uncharacterized repeat protein (TIGR01451 family)